MSHHPICCDKGWTLAREATVHPYLHQIAHAQAQPRFEPMRSACVQAIPLLDSLAQTPQDPLWHAEGNVATHTALVLEALNARFSAFSSPRERLILSLAALLHDIGKPLTTRSRHVDGVDRVIAPRHADVGCSYLACRLLDLELPWDVVYGVLDLVRDHDRPLECVRRQAPRRAWDDLAWRSNVRSLYRLAWVNMSGRVCSERASLMDNVELFELMCHEYGLLNNREHPLKGWSSALPTRWQEAPVEHREKLLVEGFRDRAAGRISTLDEAVARAYRWGDAGPVPRLVMTVGPSGAGKSTWVREHLPGYEIISLDVLREQITGSRSSQKRNDEVLRVARGRLQRALAARRDVVWEATSLRRDFRDTVVAEGLRYGAHVTLVVFHLPLELYTVRNRAREHAVAPSVLRRQIARWQWPSDEEAHRVMMIDGEGDCVRDTRTSMVDWPRGRS